MIRAPNSANTKDNGKTIVPARSQRMRLAGPAILSEKYGANNHPEPIVVVMTAIAMLISVRFRFNVEAERVSEAIRGPGHQWF